MTGFAGPGSQTDPFTKFWSDMMAGMGGAAPQGSAQEDCCWSGHPAHASAPRWC